MPMSEEMQEALAILREDAGFKAVKRMELKHKELLERFDRYETERRSGNAGQSGSGNPNTQPPNNDPGTSGNGPTPPPVRQENTNPQQQRRRKRFSYWPDDNGDN
jgi:hypothetical protein